MKRKFISAVAVVMALLLLLISCAPASPPDIPADIPSGGEVPNTVTNVKSVWSSGDLDFEKLDGTSILKLDGTNGDAEITSATIAAGTATALTITTLTAPTVSGTTAINDLTSSNASITGGTIASPTITSPTVTGTGTAILTSANITTIAPNAGTLNITTPSISTPTITGTPVIANHASGNASFAASGTSIVVTHGLSGTPTRVFLTMDTGIPGTAASATGYNAFYWSLPNSTNFTVTSMTATNITIGLNWLAFIADE